MAAGLLFRRAAGMENRAALVRRQTRQFQFLERRCRHGGNLRPMFNDSRRKIASLANFPVGSIVLELQRKELDGEPVKISEGRVTRAPIWAFQVRASWNSALRKNGLAQTRGEV